MTQVLQDRGSERSLDAFLAAADRLYLSAAHGGFRLRLRREGRLMHDAFYDAAAMRAAAARDPRLQAQIEQLSQPLPPLAGVDFTRPRVMGIINVTPDSFSDGGRFLGSAAAIAQGRALAEAGADLLDIGGESTRPGAEPVELKTELARVLPVIEGLRDLGVPLSIDTRRAAVMRAAVQAGATIINDVSGLTFDAEAAATAAALKVPVILMHMRGTPDTMMAQVQYDDVALDVHDELASRIAGALAGGIDRRLLVVDPGIGFAKQLDHNLDLLNDLPLFRNFGLPVLIGVSRKGFIGKLTGIAAAEQRVAGSVAAGLWAIRRGANILRVHDVVETVSALHVWQALAESAGA